MIKSRFVLSGDLLTKSSTNTIRRRASSESEVQMRDNSHAEILVVDDDAMSRRVLAQLLGAAGYNCRVSNDGSCLLYTSPSPRD